jgi:hypothetical protein
VSAPSTSSFEAIGYLLNITSKVYSGLVPTSPKTIRQHLVSVESAQYSCLRKLHARKKTLGYQRVKILLHEKLNWNLQAYYACMMSA